MSESHGAWIRLASVGRQVVGSTLSLCFLLVSIGCCYPKARWSKTDELISRLRCGMSETEIHSICQDYDGVELSQPEFFHERCELLASKGRTHICLHIEDGRLLHVQVSWQDHIMHRQTLQEVDLCGRHSQQSDSQGWPSSQSVCARNPRLRGV